MLSTTDLTTEQCNEKTTIQQTKIIKPATSTLGVQVMHLRKYDPPSNEHLYHAELRCPRIAIDSSIAPGSGTHCLNIYLSNLRIVKKRIHQVIKQLEAEERELNHQIKQALNELINHEITTNKKGIHHGTTTIQE